MSTDESFTAGAVAGVVENLPREIFGVVALGVQFDHLAIGGCEDVHGRSVVLQIAPNGFDDLVECIIGSSGIVMRESHPFDASQLADLGNVFHRTVAPALVVGVFFIRELGVMNHQIRTREKFAVTLVEFMHLRLLAGKSRSEVRGHKHRPRRRCPSPADSRG